MKQIAIAIDGPAASGKSTVGASVAAHLGYVYVDTGAMYRAVTWAVLERDIAVTDEAAMAALAEQLPLDITNEGPADGRQYTVLAAGRDVTWDIRQPRVNAAVSPVSACAGVRAALVPKQRLIAARGGVVMVGRDIGTVVWPQAEVKVYLDASLEERARRRWAEAQARGMHTLLAEVQADLAERDRIDSTRQHAPLTVAPDALVIDSTGLSVTAVVARILDAVAEAVART